MKKLSIEYAHQIRLGQTIHPLNHYFSMTMASNLTSIPKFRTLGLNHDYKFKSECSLHILNHRKWALNHYTR